MVRPVMNFRDKVYESIKDVVCPNNDIEITDETRLAVDLNADELDVFELALKLEEVFEIIIPDSAEQRWGTALDVFNLVKERVDKKQAQSNREG